MTPPDECLLNYDILVPQGALQVGTTASIRVVVTANQEVRCDYIKIVLPVGMGADHLTTLPGNIEAQRSPSNRWSFSQRPSGSGTFQARPVPAARKITPEDEIVLSMTNIAVNAVIGSTTMSIEEKTKVGTGTSEVRIKQVTLSKLPAGLVFTDLRPRSLLVARSDPAELVWRRSEPVDTEYRLTYDQVPSPGDLVTDYEYWKTNPLFHDTQFKLELQARQGDASVRHALTTSVTVAHPNLALTDLSATGTVRLLRQRQVIELDEDQPASILYTVDTDCLVGGWVRTRQNGVTGTLSITVDGGRPYSASVQSVGLRQRADDRRPLPWTPVAVGARITITRKSRGAYLPDASLTCLPLGNAVMTAEIGNCSRER